MAFNKKKDLLVVALLTVGVCQAQAQETLKVMLEQLAALKGYVVTAEKGYRIAEDGLHLVRDIKAGEFGLHQVFFGSLKTVDDATLQCPALTEAEQLVGEMDNMFTRSIKAFESSGHLRSDEMRYVNDLQGKVSAQGMHDRESLRVLTQDGLLAMTDGERIGKINNLAAIVRERYRAIKGFLTEVAWIIAQRQKEGNYVNTLKKWYGIQ